MFNGIRVSFLAATMSAAFLATVAAPALRASEIDRKTTMIFSAPVEVSGHMLPAGTYVFRTLDQDRNLVLVTNDAEDHVFALVHTIPVESATASAKTRVGFAETSGSAPEAIHTWFYPGDTTGWEFSISRAEKRAE
jgi:hypothetical protein